MIKVNDRFSFNRDSYSWELVEMKDGKDDDGKPKKQPYKTWHPTIEQVCHVILDRSSEGSTVEDIIDAMAKAKKEIKEMLKELNIK
jgi:hypothetical protein